MKVSVGTDNTKFTPVEVTDLAALAKVATSGQWSSGVFKDDYRNIGNFLAADSIALDIDNEDELNQTTLAEATKLFAEFKHLIMTTKSHGKDKNGVTADRFRVVLFFSRTVTDAEEYYATWHLLRKKFPFIDQACSDPSRLWYASKTVVSVNEDGALLEPANPHRPEVANKTVASRLPAMGELSKATYKFLLEGAPAGQRNNTLFKAARDCHEQGMTKDEFISRMQRMILSTQNWATRDINEKDLKTIESAFTGEPKYSPRSAFNLVTLSELMETTETVEYVLDGVLAKGDLSIVAGAPKLGKSTLIRQLVLAIAHGNPFLERKTIQGKCMYLALEEKGSLIKEEMSKQGASKDEPNIILHMGAPKKPEFLDELRSIINSLEIKFLVIDTFMLASRLADVNSYAGPNEFLTKYREVARETGCHIMFIHHTNKGEGHSTTRISGSQSIHGAVDNALIFTGGGQQRYLSTSQRGGKAFSKTCLIFDKETLTYSLGMEVEDEF